MSVPIISTWRGQTDFALDLANYADLKPCARMAYGDFLFASLLDMQDRQYLWDQLLLARTDVQLADMLITLNPDLFARMAFTLMPTVLDQWLNAMGLTVSDYLSSVDGYVLFGAGYSDLLKETLMGMGHASNGWRYAVAEHHLYGSSRVGLHQTQLQLRERKPDLTVVYATVTTHVEFYRGKRNYELSNHLGNFNGCWFCEARPYSHESRERSDSGVQATLSDKRRSVCNEELGIAYFEAEVLTQTDYYPFGMMMPDRQWSAGAEGYRYGFNGMERDINIGSSVYDYGFRIYNPNLGRFLSIDPLFRTYPYYTPYQFAGNNVIKYIDLDGLEASDPQDPNKQADGGVPAGNMSQNTQPIAPEVSVEEGFKTDFINDVETPVNHQLETNPTRIPPRNILVSPLGSEITGDKGQYQGRTAKVSGVRIVTGGERLLSIYKQGGIVTANPNMPNESSELFISSDPFIPKSGAETGVYNIQVFTIEPPKYKIEIIDGIEVEKMVKEGQYLFFNYQITVIPLL